MTTNPPAPPVLGEPIATRIYSDPHGTVTVRIGRPQPWSEHGRALYVCPYSITGDIPDAPGGGDAYATGIDDLDALMLAAHAIESVVYLWNVKLGRALRSTAGLGGWRLTYPPPTATVTDTE
ncbi:hypothetical protein [Nocardia sp. NPDC051981]|uniref:DUF6968 family protein n=1 Tax=Nocardia sp. NPDC051981 TaxID=3155417 RepID=UPI00341D9CC9